MSKLPVKRIRFAKIVVVLAVAFCLGVGLCGIDDAFMARFRSSSQEFGPNSIVGGIGAWAIVLSAAGLVVTCVLWVALSLLGGSSDKGTEPQRLFDKKDDEEFKG
jgi:hypothetical protein